MTHADGWNGCMGADCWLWQAVNLVCDWHQGQASLVDLR